MMDGWIELSVMVLALSMAGLCSGFAGGLFGIGGGIITVPVLYTVFNLSGTDSEISFKTAIGTSLAVIIVTSLRSMAAHHKAGKVDLDLLRNWSAWIGIGAAVGGLAARWVSVDVLSIIFAGGAAYIAYSRLRRRKKEPPVQRKRLNAPHIKIPFGIGAGLFSALMGFGGGGVGIIIMTAAGRSMHESVGTSSGFGMAVAVPGVVGFICSGWGIAGLPLGAIGYLSVPAFLSMALAAGIAAPFGARTAHKTSGDRLSQLFGIYVLIAAIGLLIDVHF